MFTALKQKIILLLTAVSVAFTMIAPTASADNAEAPIFKDIKSSFAKEDIITAYKAGIVKGLRDTEFGPKEPLSLEQFIIMLQNGLGTRLQSGAGSVPSSVKHSDWAAANIRQAAADGWLDPLLNRNLKAKITRQEAAILLIKALIPADSQLIQDELYVTFGDQKLMNEKYRDHIRYLAQIGIIKGVSENRFAPELTLTREQGVTFVLRLLSTQLIWRGTMTMEASKDYESAHQDMYLAYLISGSSYSLQALGSLYANIGEWKKALELYQLSLAGGNPNPSIYGSIAYMYLKLSDYKQALSYQEKAVKLLPDSPLMTAILAQIYAAAGEDAKFEDQLGKLASSNDAGVRMLASDMSANADALKAGSSGQPAQSCAFIERYTFASLTEKFLVNHETMIIVGLTLAGIAAGFFAPWVGIAIGIATVAANGYYLDRYINNKNADGSNYATDDAGARTDKIGGYISGIFAGGAAAAATKLLPAAFDASLHPIHVQRYQAMHSIAVNPSLKGLGAGPNIASYIALYDDFVADPASDAASSSHAEHVLGNSSEPDHLIKVILDDIAMSHGKIALATDAIANGSVNSDTWCEVIHLETNSINYWLGYLSEQANGFPRNLTGYGQLKYIADSIKGKPISQESYERFLNQVLDFETELQIAEDSKLSNVMKLRPYSYNPEKDYAKELAKLREGPGARTYGSAYYDAVANQFILTENKNWQVGSIWLHEQLTESFNLEFSYQAGGGTGADGFSLMLFSPPYGIGEAGGSLGYSGQGYGVIFNNYQKNEIKLVHNELNNVLQLHTTDKAGDFQWHRVKVSVTSSGITVLLDDEEILNYIGDIQAEHLDIGFSAATGSYNNWHIVKDITLQKKS